MFSRQVGFFRCEEKADRKNKADGATSREADRDVVSLFYTNANSITNKMDELKNCVNLYDMDVICVVETWLNDGYSDAEIYIPGYTIFRQDRNFNIHNAPGDGSEPSERGGSVIYVKSGIASRLISTFVAPDSVAIEIDTAIGKVVIACVYRSQSLDKYRNKELLTAIKKLCVDNETNEIIIVGDRNLPKVSWISGTVTAPLDTKDDSLLLQIKFVDMITDLGLHWHISITDQITRRKVVGGILQESTLDQVLTVNDAIVEKVSVLSPIGKSDHVCLKVDLNIDMLEHANYINKVKKNWGKISPKELENKSLNIDWSYTGENLSVEEMWGQFYSKLMKITDSIPDKKRGKFGSLQPYCDENGKQMNLVKVWYELSLTRKWSGVPNFSFYVYLF